jgi:hypothetical protein
MRGWAREPIERMEVKAPAAPRTPTMASATAEKRWEEVVVGKVMPSGCASVVLVDVMDCGGGELKKDIGSETRITPRRETMDAYWAARGKGSLRKR